MVYTHELVNDLATVYGDETVTLALTVRNLFSSQENALEFLEELEDRELVLDLAIRIIRSEFR